ncbi:MAG: ArsR/SmtB family transcription factor [Candidatus Ranarchaeia archaeon]
MDDKKGIKRLWALLSSGKRCAKNDRAYTQELKKLASKVIDEENELKKIRIFKALADPTRLRILGVLEHHEMCVCEVMVALGLTQPTASHHLRIMENAALVRKRKDGKWVFYRISEPELVKGLRELGLL